MNETITNYALPVLKLFTKIANKEDCTAECEQVKALEPQEIEEILKQLFEQIGKDGFDTKEIVTVIKKIGMVDADYVDDYVTLMAEQTESKIVPLVKKLLSRKPYKKTILSSKFIRRLTFLAVNTGDTKLLAELIQKIEAI